MGLPVMLKYAKAIAFTRNPQVARRRIGALALRTPTEPEEARRKVIESRISLREWPAGRLQITAVDAATGEFTVFDAASGDRCSTPSARAARCLASGRR